MRPDLISIEQFAKEMGVTVATARHWRAHDRAPHFFRVGKPIYTTRPDIEAWLEAKREAKVSA